MVRVGAVTGTIYNPGDYIYPKDIEIYYAEDIRKARMKDFLIYVLTKDGMYGTIYLDTDKDRLEEFRKKNFPIGFSIRTANLNGKGSIMNDERIEEVLPEDSKAFAELLSDPKEEDKDEAEEKVEHSVI